MNTGNLCLQTIAEQARLIHSKEVSPVEVVNSALRQIDRLNKKVNAYITVMPEEAINDFEAIGKEPNGLEKQKRLLAELLDKNQLYVNLSEIDDAQFKVSDEDKALNKAFYGEAYNA